MTTQLSALFLLTCLTAIEGTFAPQTKTELQNAVHECLQHSSIGDCTNLSHGPIGSWDVSSVADMDAIFLDATNFNQNLSSWDVSHVTSMRYMFQGAASFNKDLSSWEVSHVKYMDHMFEGATSFDQDLSCWDVSSVAHMQYMFCGAISFDQGLCGPAWVSSQANKTEMFTGSSASITSKACTDNNSTSTTTTTTCPHTCDGFSCDNLWYIRGRTCSQLSKGGCDCTGCSCPGDPMSTITTAFATNATNATTMIATVEDKPNTTREQHTVIIVIAVIVGGTIVVWTAVSCCAHMAKRFDDDSLAALEEGRSRRSRDPRAGADHSRSQRHPRRKKKKELHADGSQRYPQGNEADSHRTREKGRSQRG